MGGSQEKMDIQFAPLMSKLQESFLNSMLGGVIKGVEGFPLGAGFPGYGPDMYSPKPFEYGYEPSTRRRKDEGGGNGDEGKTRVEDGDGDGDGGRGGDRIRDGNIPPRRPLSRSMMTPGGFTPGGGPAPSMMTPGIPAMGGQAPGGQVSQKPLDWFSMLNQQDPMAMIPQMLTSPLMDPWRYGLTGNYPRRT